MDRYSDYCAVFDTGRETVPVFAAFGQWAGEVDNSDAIATPIDIRERVNGGRWMAATSPTAREV
ncbi:hypothetical protein ABZX38_18080 [Streptomyces longwoodensis]|uniref:hypothetical protein n=1 Tax=Streptomyces longwoodensis TaxID=68231 RepID=UPI0033A309A6